MKQHYFEKMSIIAFAMMIYGCEGKIEINGKWKCVGSILEVQRLDNEVTEYNINDSVTATIENKAIEIKGPTELKVAQYFDRNDQAHIGYKFKICEIDDELIKFNNFNCKEENKYPSFDAYYGEFNKITQKMVIKTERVRPLKDINSNQSASYRCEHIKQ